jgi:hypothetical protein
MWAPVNQCGPGAHARINDCGPGRVLYCEPSVQLVRAATATHLLDAGADLRFVQDWIGHASIRNTVIYAQLTSHRRDEEARKVFASQYVV